MRYCYVTNELYPRDKGGIGRLLHNIIQHRVQAQKDDQISVVLPYAPAEIASALMDSYRGIAVLYFSRPLSKQEWGFIVSNAAASIPVLTDSAVDALGVIDALHCAEREQGASFDVIEVPDHGGLGAYLIRARAAGQGFADTQIVCRLHSSFSIIAAHEPFEHARGLWAANRLDLEEQTIAQADWCIAHLDAIARANKEHFNLPDDWSDRVQVSFPPVLWPAPSQTAHTPGRDFIFASRFQSFKRPEMFVRGAMAYLSAYPDTQSMFRMISYGFDPHYVDRIRLMIPPALRHTITVETNLGVDARQAAISTGILVQPSAFESLCVLAYEAAASGRTVLLSRDCAAFGQELRWKDKENCLMFDANPGDLAAVMHAALSWRPCSTVSITPDPAHTLPTRSHTARQAASASVCILANRRSGISGLTAFYEVAQSTPTYLLLPPDVLTPADLASGITPIALPTTDFAGQAILDFAKSSGSTVIILCRPDTTPSVDFISSACAALTPGIAVSTNAVIGSDPTQLVSYGGGGRHLSLAGVRACPPCLAVHVNDLPAVIDPLDDRDLVDRAISRIESGALGLALGPVPQISLSNPPIMKRKISGFGMLARGIQRLGVDLAGAVGEPTLLTQPLVARRLDAPNEALPDAGIIEPLQQEPVAIRLSIKPPLGRFVIAAQARLSEGKQPVAHVSLQIGHDIASSLAAHKLSRNMRQIEFNQNYQMRWGPFEPDITDLTLIIDGEPPAKLNLADFVCLTLD